MKCLILSLLCSFLITGQFINAAQMIGTEEGSYTISGEYSDDGDEDYLTMRTDDIYRLPGAIAPSARNQE
ncbi:TPA: hypothetical protein DIC20_04790 [Candidatus Dependentiae bacterium]|nr:MAG: hypothetical protein US03_C0007G0016 [candidate division TM6 bacterium GW2011_GWF2_36_131]KKQ02712.1 MAG: hypothetical protein US13_C0011G0020 [candidate division TM6 bacterium GW2011_GWE2_36_25]KKQ19599.1 MAG: hypothetical protein US32_C0007G0052 [candidate division TM6 bacterium GW2011_GWA2_36_9]HBR71113.1 hypothetical protein [Candidatus Dependentiae bacterium]HCU00991.1 hypothetical protein [Candidatus Dependentiae bacterium]